MPLTYLEHVTTYFVSLAGKGVTLSSRDLALIRQWEADGLPAPAVCRALDTAVQQRRRKERFSIADCAETVQRLVAPGVRQIPATRTDGMARWTPSGLLQQLTRVGQRAETEALKTVYRELYRRVRSMETDTLSVQDLTRLDEQAVALAFSSLPSAEQSRIRADVGRRSRQLLGPGASQRACDRLAGALRGGVIRERLGLLLPSELVAEEEPS